MPPLQILVTCEHAKEDIPESCLSLLAEYAAAQEMHRRFDWGAEPIAHALAALLDAPLYLGQYTRLAIDLNRSLDHPALFSPPMAQASSALRQSLIDQLYLPFRQRVEDHVSSCIRDGRAVLHLSLHSFTPVYEGTPRSVQLGILYNDSRSIEGAFADLLHGAYASAYPELCIRRNEPYLGTDDGHTTALRQRFPDNYAGIEIEYCQGFDLVADAEKWAGPIARALARRENRLF